MKKHYIILGIVLLAGLFFIPTLLKRCDGPVVPAEELTEEPSTLNSRIETIGENRFAKSEYIALRNEITGYASARKISAMERDNYRSTLNIMLQKALALSYKYNLEHDCYATNMAELNSAGDSIKNPIYTLKTQQIIYKRFQAALNFSQRLLAFCSGQYSAEGANKLKGDYTNIISRQSFTRCSRIQQIKNQINQECDVFGIFHVNFNAIVEEQNDYFYYPLDGPQLTKYRWYRAKIIEKQKD